MLPIFRLLFKEEAAPKEPEPVQYKRVEPPGKGCPFAIFASPFIIGDQINKAIGVDKYIDKAIDFTGVPALLNGIQSGLTSGQTNAQKQLVVDRFTESPQPAPSSEFFGESVFCVAFGSRFGAGAEAIADKAAGIGCNVLVLLVETAIATCSQDIKNALCV